MTGDGLRTETTYLEGLTHAEDNAEAAVKGSLCFGGNELGYVSRHHSIACLSPFKAGRGSKQAGPWACPP